MKTKEQRIDESWEEFEKIQRPITLEEYRKKCEEINSEPEENKGCGRELE